MRHLKLYENFKQNYEIYFDMDGVLADFDKSIKNDPTCQKLKMILNDKIKQCGLPENMEINNLKEICKGQQTDPNKKDLKKAFNDWRGYVYIIASKPNFFFNLEPLEGSEEMLKYAAEINNGKLPHILTAPIESSKEQCEREKKAWINKHFPGLTDTFICTVSKYKHATPNSILIDDRSKYINTFVDAGGIGILHDNSNWEKSMEKLKEIIG